NRSEGRWGRRLHVRSRHCAIGVCAPGRVRSENVESREVFESETFQGSTTSAVAHVGICGIQRGTNRVDHLPTPVHRGGIIGLVTLDIYPDVRAAKANSQRDAAHGAAARPDFEKP